MPACQIVIEISGVDPLISEGLGETFYVASVSNIAAGVAIANNYAEWRRTWLAKGLFITSARASLIQQPPVSDSVPLNLVGNDSNTSGDTDRDLLSSGLMFRCKDATGAAKGTRFFRGFQDDYVDYNAIGQEITANANIINFRDGLLSKTTTLGLGLRSLSRNAAVTFPKPITALTIDGSTLTGFTATGLGAQAGYELNETITVKGARGTRAGVVNGVYRIVSKSTDTIGVTPNKTLPLGFTYILGSARTYLRVPEYPVITQAQFVRFGARQVGNARNRRRSRRRRV